MTQLKDPFQIKGLKLHNRLVMPPMATGKSDDGKVSEQLLAYYDEKTKGGKIGLVIVEHEYILPEGKASDNQMSVSEDSDIEGLRALADLIHRNGSKVFLQINHAGGKACADLCKAPSAMEYTRRNAPSVVPKEMDMEDIQNVINGFVQAARRCRIAGYDGVEIHGAHGYLLSQFYSPLTNRRTDAYNGLSVEGRTRLHCEVLQAVRKEVGEDYPVAIRFGAVEDLAGGAKAEDAAEAAKRFVRAGADLIDVSGGLSGYIRPEIKDAGYFRYESDLIAKAAGIPVLTAGGIETKEQADALLSSYRIDLIGVARAILKDSEWALKNLG